ncbi:MAG: SAM-dependent methyltransferase, partial [Clostridia bacterium]|nr:SAM-dependent methyltransferase [Clostridia bacterium]
PTLVLPDDRLKTAASMIRPGGVAVDVGTDHGYIPIWLLQQGICPFAVASDINRGPLERAKENGIRYGVMDRLALVLCDGLDGVEPEKHGVTDVCICGMGGELIASIVTRSAYVKEKQCRLVLQPMSSGYELRKALLADGFVIREEVLCQAAGRVYSCIRAKYAQAKYARAEYIGTQSEYTEGELLAGREMNRQDPLYPVWMERHKNALRKQITGREAGGLDTTYEKALLAELERMV